MPAHRRQTRHARILQLGLRLAIAQADARPAGSGVSDWLGKRFSPLGDTGQPNLRSHRAMEGVAVVRGDTLYSNPRHYVFSARRRRASSSSIHLHPSMQSAASVSCPHHSNRHLRLLDCHGDSFGPSMGERESAPSQPVGAAPIGMVYAHLRDLRPPI